MSAEAEPVTHEELLELLGEVQGWVEMESLRGATVLPGEPLLAPGELPLSGLAPSNRGGQRPQPNPTREAPRTPAAPSFSPATPQQQRRTARPTAPPSPSPPAPRAAPTPAPAPAPAGQVTLGRWKAWAEPAAAAASPQDPLLAKADTLPAVRAHLGDCTRCGLCEGRRNIVFGVGDPNARLMVVGEGPGAQEDRQGEPFVGPAGQMLDRMLAGVLGLEREQVYIANIVKCRPPGNRNPSADEIARCRPFLEAQLRVVNPDLVLVLGSVAYKALMSTSAGIKRSRGAWADLSWPGGSARVMPTFHPAYLLRRPEDKRLTFQDLKQLKGALDALG